MSNASFSADPDRTAPRQFRTTHWSMVQAAQEGTADSRAALAQLCQTYWGPVHAFVRRWVPNASDAQDLTQEFFAQLLEKNYLSRADRQYGRFRTFLLTAVQRFLSKERSRATAQKRGGGRIILSLDGHRGENDGAQPAGHQPTPEQEFDRQWARHVLETALVRLRGEYREDKERVFEELKPLMTRSPDADAYQAVADRLGMTPGAVKTAVYRLRQRYRALLLSEIAQTVSDPQEVQEELQFLFRALG